MTDQTTVESPGAVPMANVIDTGTTPHESGGGIKATDLATEKPEVKRPESIRDTLETVKKEQQAKVEEADKAEADPKRDKAKEAKPEADKTPDEAKEPAGEKAEKGAAEKPAAGQGGDEARQSEGRKHSEPPSRFLPEARTKWANVPNEVKAEFHRVSQEYETEINESRAARERYDAIREYDEMARSNGGDLKQTLEKVTAIEAAIARNPIAGLEMILREVGPRKPDGSHMSLVEVARFVAAQSPEQMRALMAQGQQAPQKRQIDPEVARLSNELSEVKSQMAAATLMPVIQDFASRHPDYHALEPQMAAILQSGVIDQVFGSGLTPAQRLTEAYRMAGGTPSQSETAPAHPDTSARPETLDAGTKSVRGAPNGGDDPVFDRPATSTRDLLRSEMRKLRS